MEKQQPQGNGSTVLMVIAVGLIGFGLGWFVGVNNVSPESADSSSSAVADYDGEDLADSEVLPVGDSPVMGNPSAPVTIVEFTSMQCPHCATAGGTLKQLVENNPDDVRVVFKHFPLSMQQQAKPASIAAQAAHNQDKFWEMKDALFERIRDYRNQDMEDLGAELAADIGIDVDQFREDFNDPATEAIVDRDMALGGELGVRGTPHFFINGEVVNGAQPLQQFQQIVDTKLAEANELREDGVADDEIYAHVIEQELGSAQPQAQQQQRDRPQPAAAADVNVQNVEIQDHDHIKGASEEDALVTVIEFSSFQCPHCARGAGTLKELVEKYPNEVRVVFKHFPLSFQEHSEPASRAAVAAGNQDNFWEMYDALYDNQRSLGQDGIFVRLAEDIGLDIGRFNDDFAAAETAKIVSDSQDEGRAAGIRGTPGFLINGIVETGAQPLASFSAHVDSQIEIAKEIKAERNLSGNELYTALVAHNKENAGGGAEPEPAAEEPTVLDDDALSIGNSYTKGAEDAAVTIYEFSSFQCPFCARGAETMAEVLEEYDGDVRLVYKNFPLPFQSESEPAARAALSAGEQGKFWEMYEALYDNQQRFAQDGFFNEMAENIGLDMNQFQSDFESDAIAKQVADEQSEGQSVGVRGTPAFFINGEMLSGAQPIQAFRNVIDKHL